MDPPSADAHLCPEAKPVAISKSGACIVEDAGTIYCVQELLGCLICRDNSRILTRIIEYWIEYTN